MAVSDTVAWEHSEPGTGIPPIPRDTHPEDDPAIAGGWRRDQVPAAFPEYADPFLNPIFITLPGLPYEAEEGG